MNIKIDYEYIIRRVDELCVVHKMSKYRLAQLTGVSQSALSRMLRQQSTLSLPTLTKICDAFGITLAQFFSDGTYPDLTDAQIEVLHLWDDLSKSKQEYILMCMKALKEVD